MLPYSPPPGPKAVSAGRPKGPLACGQAKAAVYCYERQTAKVPAKGLPVVAAGPPQPASPASKPEGYHP